MAGVRTTSFTDVLQICRARGREVWVYFEGGSTALAQVALPQLRPMPFKWTDGQRDDPNWIDGEAFRAITSSRRRIDVPPAPRTGPNDELKNYFDKASSLNEILRICERERDRVIVGFEGGRSALRRSTAAALQARQFFKWDYVDHPVGVKDKSNWLRGDEFAEIVHALGGQVT